MRGSYRKVLYVSFKSIESFNGNWFKGVLIDIFIKIFSNIDVSINVHH